MPDLTRHVFYHCPSVESHEAKIEGSTGKVYTVRLGYSRGGPTQFAWSCDCPGFKFRGRCKHIVEAKESHCGWSEFVHGGEVARDENNVARCPLCGELAIAQEHAV